jgi:DNA gyrase inhibitor GyrI
MTLWKKLDGQWMIHRDVAVPVEQAAAARTPGPLSVEVRRRAEAQYAVVLPMTGSYRQHVEAIVRLVTYMEKAGIPPVGTPFGRYFDDPDVSTEQNLRWQVGLFVARRPEAALEPPFEVWTLGPGEEAWAVVPGPHEGARPWSHFLEKVAQSGYQPVGEAMELWLDGPRTEMRIAVQRSRR